MQPMSIDKVRSQVNCGASARRAALSHSTKRDKPRLFLPLRMHLETEEALTGWLRSEITRIERRIAKLTDPLLEARVEFSKLAEA